jgi:exoribonuclease-2
VLEKGTNSDADNRTLAKIRQSAELQEQLQLQNEVAQSLRRARHEAGALTFKRSEMTPVFSPEGEVLELRARQQNVASMLIEDFMIASNQATARFLDKHGFPSLRRVVRTPERWGKIVSIAALLGHELPDEPDAKSLEGFLRIRRQTDPAGFADLCLVIIKLLGRGEYLAASPGSDTSGHFALAATSYTHSTAPNRRFPDLVTQRLLKAAFSAVTPPYSIAELDQLAVHCTERENAANKVERFVKKCAAAALLLPRIGELFDGIVTGVTSRGTWVRISRPEVEGKVFGATSELDVGDHIQVRLISADPEQGFIDFDLA